MNYRRPVAPVVAAAVIGSVTTYLLFRLSHQPPAPASVAVATPAASPAVSLPSTFPVVDETSAPPVKWTATTSGAKPSPYWKIAFECYESDADRTDIWTANGDGSGAHRVLTDAQSACWSPQHRMLAFARGGNVWVANADGTDARPITFWPALTVKEKEVVEIHGIAWNAHDNVLSFSRGVTYDVSNADSDESEKVYGNTIYHVALKPAANAQGTQTTPFAPVAYETPTSTGDVGNRAIWRRIPPRFDLTEHHGRFNFAENEYPAWSRSGTKMAFVREGDVWLAEGEAEKWKSWGGYAQDWEVSRIAASARYDGHTVGASHWIVATTGISWAPDESWIAYGVERISGSGQNDLHILRHRESGWQDTLLKLPGDSPSISADGRWILYSFHGTLYAMTPDQKTRISLIPRGKDLWCTRAVW